MKALKMNFLCSVFGMQFLLALNTVWAADPVSSPPTDAQVAAWREQFEKENDYLANARGSADDDLMDLFTNVNDPVKDPANDPVNDDDEEEMPDADPVNDDDDDEEMLDVNDPQFEEWLESFKTANSNHDDPLNENFDEELTDIDQGLDDLLMPENRVSTKIEAEKLFRWAENGLCDKTKLDLGLDESTILSDSVIANLKVVHSYISRKTPHLTSKDLKNPENILIATAQMMGTSWHNHTTTFYPTGNREIYVLAMEKYDQLLGNLAKKRSDSDRVPLVCSDKNVRIINGKDGKGGVPHWDFTDFNIQKKIPEKKDPKYCSSGGSRTAVWPDLVWICNDAWPTHGMTLQDMIKDQENLLKQVQERPKNWSNDYVQLEDRLSMGGVMLHVLLHFFEIVKGDLEVEPKYGPYRRVMGMKSEEGNVMMSAWDYSTCIALGNKDAHYENPPKSRQTIRNPQNLVWFATMTVLSDIPWWKRAGLPTYVNRGKTRYY